MSWRRPAFLDAIMRRVKDGVKQFAELPPTSCTARCAQALSCSAQASTGR